MIESTNADLSAKFAKTGHANSNASTITGTELQQYLGRGSRMSVTQIMAYDLRTVCVHEFAHAAVALHFGVVAQVRIVRNPTGGDVETYYTGQCSLFHRPADQYVLRMIGLAGTLAELIETEPDAEGWEFFDYLDFLVPLSETDAELAGDYCEDDVEVCVNILHRLWPQIEQAIRYEVQLHNY